MIHLRIHYKKYYHNLLCMLLVFDGERVDSDREGHTTRAQHIDHAEIVKAYFEPEFLQTPCKPTGRNLRLILTGRACARYFTRRPNAGRRIRST